MRRARLVLSVLFVVGLIAAWVFTLRPTYLGGPTGYIIVSGQSMEPNLHDGDLVITTRFGEYEEGDVIAFDAEGRGNVIHRIIGGDAETGFVTQGDNRDSPDEWRPRPSDIVGESWVHIPGAGKVFSAARNPGVIAALAGGISALAILGGQSAHSRRQRRKGEFGVEHQAHTPDTKTARERPGGSLDWPVVALGVVAAITLAAGLLTVLAFSSPAQETAFVERSSYAQEVAFDYSAVTDRSTVYPDGRVPLVTPDNRDTATPLYTRLVRAIDLGYHYRLTTEQDAQVSGSYVIKLVAKAGDSGWENSQEIVPSTPFDGPGFDGLVTIDLAAVEDLIRRIEDETGYTPSSYELAVVPEVTLTGMLGGEPLDTAFAPSLVIEYTKTRITLADQLVYNDVESTGAEVPTAGRVDLAGVASLPVKPARLVALPMTLTGLLASGLLAAVAFAAFGRDERAKVRTRYGATFVPVRHLNNGRARRVEVATLEDLGRLAQRDGGIIFYKSDAKSDYYFIPESAVTYEHTVVKVIEAKPVRVRRPPPSLPPPRSDEA
jgi:signal peptidase I